MAIVHTKLPIKAGELRLAEQLKALSDDSLHLWFSVNFVPNVKDIDIVLWHERVGAFVIEVKAVALEEIESFGWHSCKIQNRAEDQGPEQQAWSALYSLKNFLADSAKPYLTGVACWPLITRSAWNLKWDDQRVCGSYAESMLFQEDLYGEPSALKDRLEFIRMHPPRGRGPGPPFKHDSKIFTSFCSALDVNARPKPVLSDLEKLKQIESQVRKEERKQVPAFSGSRLLYTGAPGTGKTFRLLGIALRHAYEGCKVLFACFNKVLAADIKRILACSETLPPGLLEVHDVHEMIKLFFSETAFIEDHPDEWAKLVVEEMRRSKGSLTKFDTIVVDEGQDLQDWAFEMLWLHANERATLCVAAGTGQELYRQSSDSLREFARFATKRALRRNFRNTETVFRFATTCYEANWDESQLLSVSSKFKLRDQEQQVIEFQRPGGDLPVLAAMDESSLDDSSEAMYGIMQGELMVSEFARIIRTELERLDANHRPMDVLILVPTESSNQKAWVTEALRQCGIPYIDYTQPENRRFIAPADKVRVCTFHSARGIEGQKVVIFGLEGLEEVAKSVGVESKKLGYIVLSRAVFDMVIAYRPYVQTKVMLFVRALHRLMELKKVPRPERIDDNVRYVPAAGTSGDPLHDLPEKRTEYVKNVIQGIPKDGGGRTDLPQEQQLKCHKTCDGFTDVYGRMAWDKVAPTITTGCFNPSKGRFLHPDENRAIRRDSNTAISAIYL